MIRGIFRNKTALPILLISIVSETTAQTTVQDPDAVTIQTGIDSIFDILGRVWRFVVFEIQGNPVQVSQIITAAIMMSLGVIFSKWIGQKTRAFLISRSNVEENTAAFIQRILFYILVTVIVLSTLQMIEIPITIFAFLGGAIAIGIGFGAQNIFNNFISGLLLMIERPVRIGDLIEVSEHLGMVTEIGARCTTIRRVDGIEILAPNSTLLESNLINYTLSDKKIRIGIKVGVAYGSPVKKVESVLYNVAQNHPRVLKNPKPEVFFDEFGDSALNFLVYMWAETDRSMELRRIRSDIRFAIDEQFRNEGITIAFPQLDVHMQQVRPLEEHVATEENGQPRS